MKINFKNFWLDLELKEKISIVLLLIPIIVMLVAWQFPVYPNENIKENPIIYLQKTLASQEIIYKLGENKEALQKDELKNQVLNKDNTFVLKFLGTDASKRFVICVFVDPNNIIRYSSTPFNRNFTDNLDLNKFSMHEISIEKNIKIQIPINNDNYLFGTWHLNVYILNQEKELTAVISKPIDFK